ncbi:MAG TPA: proline dehydrogenase family protein [Symbiobacteriaceae bacterium]|jgi:proline dehydrogenase
MALTMRKVILWFAESKSVNRFMRKHGMRIGAQRFVAGESMDRAIAAVKELNSKGIMATLDVLGESVSSAAEANAAAEEYLQLLDAINKSGVDSNVSMKLTQMGLNIDKKLCQANMERILTKAQGYKNWARVDMEDSSLTQITIDFFNNLYTKFKNTGIVLQSYLPRALKDMEDYVNMNVNVRVVKGAYAEPDTVRYPLKADTDKAYVEMCKMAMKKGVYVAVATHDEAIINALNAFVKENKISKANFEYQMLYGIRNDLQTGLVQAGYRVRVYVPFGTQWYAYLMRRLAENPANLTFFVKAYFKG